MATIHGRQHGFGDFLGEGGVGGGGGGGEGVGSADNVSNMSLV